MADRAVLYRRVSDDEQVRGYSLDFQQDVAKDYCLKHRYHVVADFEEPGLSGHDSLDEREMLQEMRLMVRRKDVDVVVVWRYDRLARDFLDQAVLIREAKFAGVRVESATEPVPDGPLGWVMQAVIGGMSEQERAAIVARTQAGVHKRVASGNYLPGAKAPYGYCWANEKKTRLLKDPLTAPIVVRIFDLVASGVSTNEVAHRLTQEGIPSPAGLPYWRQRTVSRIVHHPIYTGIAIAFRERRFAARVIGPNGETTKRTQTKPREDAVVLPEGTAPALVSKDVAQRAQAYVDQNRSSPLSGKAPDNYLLRGGLALCDVCGKTLTVRTKGRTPGTQPIYRCQQTKTDTAPATPPHSIAILTTALDEHVWETFKSLVNNPTVVADALKELEEKRESIVGSELAALRDLLTENVAQQEGLVETLTLLKQDTTKARISAQLDSLAVDEGELRLRIAALERRDTVFAAKERVLRRFTEKRDMEGLTLTEKRRLLFDFGVRVHLRPAAQGRTVAERCSIHTNINTPTDRHLSDDILVSLVFDRGTWRAVLQYRAAVR